MGVLLAIGFGGCASQNSDDSQVLAICGQKKINKNEFDKRKSDLLTRYGLPDNGQSRIQILESMIDEKLWLIDASYKGYDKDKTAQNKLQQIKDRVLLDSYAREIIFPTIQTTEEELHELFIRFNTQVTVHHLYAQTIAEADEYRKRLLAGESFDKLAREAFQNPELRDNGGLVGPFTVDEMEVAFEEAAYTLPLNEISQPIALKHGFSVMKVVSRTSKPVLTEQEFAVKKDEMRNYLESRKIPLAVKNHVDFICKKELNIKFNEDNLNSFYQSLQSAQSSEGQVLDVLAYSQKVAYTNIFKAGKKTFSYSDCVDLLHEATQTELKWVKSATDLKGLFSGLMARHQMLRTARNKGLDRSRNYLDEVKAEFEQFILDRIEDSLLVASRIPKDTLNVFYNLNKDIFFRAEKIRLNGILLDKGVSPNPLRAALVSGESFEDLASRYSYDQESANRSGDLGYFTRPQLGSEVASVWDLKPGQWIGPLKMENEQTGFFQLKEHLDSFLPPFEEIINEVNTEYCSQNRHLILQDYTRKLRESIDIQVYSDLLLQSSQPHEDGRI